MDTYENLTQRLGTRSTSVLNLKITGLILLLCHNKFNFEFYFQVLVV